VVRLLPQNTHCYRFIPERILSFPRWPLDFPECCNYNYSGGGESMAGTKDNLGYRPDCCKNML
jgi:hypothetical protein